MSFSMVIMIGLPVLFVTGSLKKIVANSGVGGKCFVLFFVCAAVLSFLPNVPVAPHVFLNTSGTFFCIAPAVYLAVKKAYACRFYIAFVIIMIISVISTLVFNSYTFVYLHYVVVGVVSLTALLFFKAYAPVHAPVLMGVFYFAQSMVQLFTDMYMAVIFNNIGVASVSVVICLFAAYWTTKPIKPRGKHETPRKRHDIAHAQAQHNKG